MIKFGVALNMPAEEGRTDAEVVREHLLLGDLAEPLGFDTLFVLEHHFTGYVMSPAPFELLAFYAGRTKRIHLGTAVIVLPWHDPVRVAEQIAFLDIICNGRCLFAFGRGRAKVEFDGFRVAMNEARARFIEAAEILIGSLSEENFKYDGNFYKIPPLTIRPGTISKPHERFYGSATSQESAVAIARLGFGMLLSTQKPWTALADDATNFYKAVTSFGHAVKPPVVLAAVSVATSRSEARERAITYLKNEWAMIDAHYQFSKGGLSANEGYESYVNTERQFGQLNDLTYLEKSTVEYADLQIVGNPEDCIKQIEELRNLIGLEHLILEFSYGNMPFLEAEKNIRLFASRVMPAFKSENAESALREN